MRCVATWRRIVSRFADIIILAGHNTSIFNMRAPRPVPSIRCVTLRQRILRQHVLLLDRHGACQSSAPGRSVSFTVAMLRVVSRAKGPVALKASKL